MPAESSANGRPCVDARLPTSLAAPLVLSCRTKRQPYNRAPLMDRSLVAQPKAVAIAVKGQQERRRWSKLREWLAAMPDSSTGTECPALLSLEGARYPGDVPSQQPWETCLDQTKHLGVSTLEGNYSRRFLRIGVSTSEGSCYREEDQTTPAQDSGFLRQVLTLRAAWPPAPPGRGQLSP
jgi:hypothetical protein